jgi:ferric-dicitrate binding protein FerR (iron transport regulator)
MNEPSAKIDERVEEIVAYLDGEADDSSADAIEQQMARDPAVRREIDSLQRAWDMLELLDMPKPGGDFSRQTVQLATQSVKADIIPTAHRRSWLVPLLWSSGTVAAFAAGWFFTMGRPSIDEQINREQPLLEKLDAYRATGDVDFLKKLRKENLLDHMDQIMEPGS